MVISFRCPQCRAQRELDDLSRDQASCPVCGETIRLEITAPMRQQNTVDRCAVCDCHKVYVQKDFNRTLGVAIFVTGAVISLVLYGFNRVWEAFAVLLGCAVADAVLYKVLPEVTICYRCHTQYRQVTPNPANRAFELGLAEKFDPLDPAQRDATTEHPAADWKGR